LINQPDMQTIRGCAPFDENPVLYL